MLYILTIFTSVIINFVVPRLIPGNPIEAKLAALYRLGVNIGGREFVEKYSALFALDQPIHIQLFLYLSSLFRGNLGFSISYFPTEVKDLLIRTLPWTIGLLGVCTIISFSCGFVLGALMGWKKGEIKASSWTKILFSIFMVLSQVPYYILGMMLIYVLIYLLLLFPYGGGVDPQAIPGTIEYIVSIIQHATLPALSIVLVSLGGWAIEARGLMVNVLGEDYLLLAKAKGLRERYIFRQYAMRNIALPMLTDLAITLGSITSGSVLVEIVFSYPGVGSLLYLAVSQLDYPVIQAVSLIIIFGVMTSALLIDLLCPFLDPRIRER
jgi:peptide/nickel transport system permease protein